MNKFVNWQAFRKLLSSNATHRWPADIQDGIFIMSELFIETVTARLEYRPVPCKMLDTLALLFDTKNDWNSKNRDQLSRGRWQEAGDNKRRDSEVTYAEAQTRSASDFSRPSTYGWLCDLINMFGERGGFDAIVK